VTEAAPHVDGRWLDDVRDQGQHRPEGLPTTAGCPAYAYQPERSATVVKRLMDAGAISCGQDESRSVRDGPGGHADALWGLLLGFDERYISGGSSAGSAVAVAKGLVDFSLGTDTAGSGRVPAAFNNIVGLKPSRGVVIDVGSSAGLPVVGLRLDLREGLRRGAEGVRGGARVRCADPFSRVMGVGQDAAPCWAARSGLACRRRSSWNFSEMKKLGRFTGKAISDLQKLGGEKVEIDYSIFRAAAALLYSGPWVSGTAVGDSRVHGWHGDEMNPVVREIISGARRYSAVDAFEADYKLRELRRRRGEWRKMDVLMLPTTGRSIRMRKWRPSRLS